MDNCSIHHIESVAKDINEVGALLQFLPPYSPDFQPIEETFSKVKAELKASKNTGDLDMEHLLLSSFLSVTPEDCKGWIEYWDLLTQFCKFT